MSVKDMVEEYLKKNNYDGLWNTDCGCFIKDLMPCNSYSGDCKPGHERKVEGKREIGWG